jgi:hypothetical protein
MNRLILVAMILCPGLAAADGGPIAIYPNLSEVPFAKQPALLTRIVNAVVIGQSCPDFELSAGEYALLNGSADILAASLGLSVEEHDAEYWQPAFNMRDADGICLTEGPKIAPLVGLLITMGGIVGPIN